MSKLISIITGLLLAIIFLIVFFLNIKGISNIFTGIVNGIMLAQCLFFCVSAIIKVMENE